MASYSCASLLRLCGHQRRRGYGLVIFATLEARARMKDNAADFFALLHELFQFPRVLWLEDRRGFVINDRRTRASLIVFRAPVPILRKTDDPVANQQRLIELMGDDNQSVGRPSLAA